MSPKPFFHAPCPSCGAPVELASSSSAFAVCGYCRSGLSLQGDTLERIGEVAQVLEDYSPLQLGSAGRWEGMRFSLVGRIQLAYPGGFWNEWRVLFEDGQAGWLGDASGQYTMLLTDTSQPALPGFESLRAGQALTLKGRRLTVVDHREARCTGAQGELPFPLTERWSARVADLRDHETVATLDYSEQVPVLYVGKPVRLESLDMQLLRAEVDIAASAGRLKGRLQALKCPACGASIDRIGGQTPHATCASCASRLDISGQTAQLIERAKRAVARTQRTVLQAGDRGVLQGATWLVIGVVCRSTHTGGESFRWSEYLLYNVAKGLRWLTFGEEQGWMFCDVLERVPRAAPSGTLEHAGANFQRKEAYKAQVDEVWGSFNWEIRRGDCADVVEYVNTRATSQAPRGSLLVSETTAHEQTWSLAVPLKAGAVASAFGKPLPAARPPTQSEWVSNAAFQRVVSYGAAGHIAMLLIRPTDIGLVFGVLAFITIMVMGQFKEE